MSSVLIFALWNAHPVGAWLRSAPGNPVVLKVSESIYETCDGGPHTCYADDKALVWERLDLAAVKAELDRHQRLIEALWWAERNMAGGES